MTRTHSSALPLAKWPWAASLHPLLCAQNRKQRYQNWIWGFKQNSSVFAVVGMNMPWWSLCLRWQCGTILLCIPSLVCSLWNWNRIIAFPPGFRVAAEGSGVILMFLSLHFWISRCLLASMSTSFSRLEKLPAVISFKNPFLFALTLPLLLYYEFSVLAF